VFLKKMFLFVPCGALKLYYVVLIQVAEIYYKNDCGVDD
jgi:hypothetical protein